MKKPSAKAFEKDYNEGKIVRGHLFRTTWQLASGEDWRWMQDLCRTNALRGMAGWMKSNGVSISEAEQATILPGVTVGENSVVGAASVVAKKWKSR